jgi:hypothetical protein
MVEPRPTYLNPFYNINYQGSRRYFEAEPNPTLYKGYEIHHYSHQQWHIVKNGVCLGMNAGINGAKRRIDNVDKQPFEHER